MYTRRETLTKISVHVHNLSLRMFWWYSQCAIKFVCYLLLQKLYWQDQSWKSFFHLNNKKVTTNSIWNCKLFYLIWIAHVKTFQMVPKLKMAYLIDIAYLFWEFLLGVGGPYFGVDFYFTNWVRFRDAIGKTRHREYFKSLHFSDRRAYATGKEDAVCMRCQSSIFPLLECCTLFLVYVHTRWISLFNRPEQVRLAMESIPSRGPLPGDEELKDRSQSLNFQSQCTFPYIRALGIAAKRVQRGSRHILVEGGENKFHPLLAEHL